MTSVSRFAWRLLALTGMTAAALAAGARPVQAQEDDYLELRRKAYDAYEQKDYKTTLECCEKMHKLRPDDAEPMYNIACMKCVLGDKEAAYEWLEKAIKAGYDEADQLANDDDFKTIRAEPRFRRILAKLRGEDVDEGKKQEKKEEKKDQEKKDDQTPAERGQKIGELTRQVIEASEAGERDKALKLAMEALEHAQILKNPQALSLTHYNVACMYSLLGKKSEACGHLEKSVAAGSFIGDMVAQIEDDVDFDNIRKEPRYKKVIEGLKAKPRREEAGEERAWEKVEPEFKVTLPSDYDNSKKVPLIVALHPFGGNMEAFTRQWKAAADEVGAILLAPQGGLRRDDDRYQWGGDLDAVEKSVMKAIDAVMDRHKIDEDKVVLTGFSQGGSMAWNLGLRHPDTFRGLIPVAGGFRLESESLLKDRAIKKLRVFIMVGGDEAERLLDGNKQAAKRLEDAGAAVKLNIYDDVGHDFPPNAEREQIKALRYVLEE